jgi:hypothetical protein
MCSPTLTWQTAARTTSLVQVASSDICSREKDEADFRHLHIAWVLIADRIGNPKPRMRWLGTNKHANAGCSCAIS